MLKYIESTGRTEEAAIEAALQKLGMDRDDVSVEVLERAKTGFLGIGASPAKVKVTYEAPDEEPVEEVKPVETVPAAPVAEEAPKAAPEAPKAPVAEEPKAQPAAATVAADERAEKIHAFLTGLLAHMGSSAIPSITLGEENTYEVELLGEHLGSLIGRRGETLDAIQQLTNYAVNHGADHRVRIHVDAENYRAKREQTLEALARKVAAKVVRLRRNVTLEPMNAYERHVIHSALQDYPGVSTGSIGTEPNRRVVVHYERSGGRGNGGYSTHERQ